MQNRYNELRNEYKEFIFNNYSIQENGNHLNIEYEFEITGLEKFISKWSFPLIGKINIEKKEAIERLVFNLGMVELISYWKIACPKNVIVKANTLTSKQEQFWRKLYFNGLGEFFFVNKIETSIEDFMEIKYINKENKIIKLNKNDYNGILVPIGGGKDSIVTLEVLKNESITTFSINRTETVQRIIDLCTKKMDLNIQRKMDTKMLDLNSKGFLNGHTPFSAIIAFSSVLTALLWNKKYIALSNECSANESTIKNTKINHQYSKSYEFEDDFIEYIKTIMESPIEYFSLLRPINEIQIAKLFSKYKKFHSVFRSCNVGSKKGIWCCKCSKCLFVYIVLSPFLNNTELIDIFGEDLLNKNSLEKEFKELAGIVDDKPFECVGTRIEVVAALKNIIENNENLPFLVKKYREYIIHNGINLDLLLSEWSSEHFVPNFLVDKLKKAREE